MEYMAGTSIRDVAYLQANHVDRAHLVEHISRAFAHQIFVAGFFSGDPHPGNLLVQSEGGGKHVPVLLDFGLTKSLEPTMQLALAKMLIAADAHDFAGLVESFHEMGFKFNQEVRCGI